MIFEVHGDVSHLDDMTKQIILDELYDDLLEEGFSEADAKFQVEMYEFELNN